MRCSVLSPSLAARVASKVERPAKAKRAPVERAMARAAKVEAKAARRVHRTGPTTARAGSSPVPAMAVGKPGIGSRTARRSLRISGKMLVLTLESRRSTSKRSITARTTGGLGVWRASWWKKTATPRMANLIRQPLRTL